jgi:hypothetical protein
MEEPLVAAIAAGDASAFARWMRGAERPIRESLRRYAASVDTEAVLQESLLRVADAAALMMFHHVTGDIAVFGERELGNRSRFGEGLETKLAHKAIQTGVVPLEGLLTVPHIPQVRITTFGTAMILAITQRRMRTPRPISRLRREIMDNVRQQFVK